MSNKNNSNFSDKHNLVTQSYLKTLLYYDSETGLFKWVNSKRGLPANCIAGRTNPKGYRVIGINTKIYMAHRLVWLYVYGEWPLLELDHIDGNKDNNRINNLREATRSQNQRNMGAHKDSKSGVKGIHLTQNGRYRATISLGTFGTLEEAKLAYNEASLKLAGKFHKE